MPLNPKMRPFSIHLDERSCLRLERLKTVSGYGHGFYISFFRRAIESRLVKEEENHGLTPTESSLEQAITDL